MKLSLHLHDRKIWLPVAVTLGFFILTVILIFMQSGVVPPHPQDQSFAGTADLRIRRVDGSWVFHYPTLGYSGGITSSLIAGIYKLIVPTTPETLNWHIRILGAFMWLGSSLMLILGFIPTLPVRLLATLLVATSGYQFIQPTSELFAGGLFSLFIFASAKRWPYWLTALFLAAFGLAKVEMVAAAIFSAFAWWIWEWKNKRSKPYLALFWTALWFGVFLFPGFVVSGADPASLSRSFFCFKLSYVDLFSRHQFSGPLTADEVISSHAFADQVMARRFPGANSVLQVILGYPKLYAEYMLLSSATSIPVVFDALKLMVIPMGLVLFRGRELKGLGLPLVLLIGTMLLTLAPALMLTVFRIRYFIKVWPAFSVLAAAGCDQLTWQSNRRGVAATLWICGLLTIAIQLYYFQDMWVYSHYR
jgi:hypothetical protein